MKKIYLLIALVLCVTLSKAQFSGGTGTAVDPYQISTADDLVFLSMNRQNGDGTVNYWSGKYYILMNDIDMTGQTFHPIGYKTGSTPSTGNVADTNYPFLNCNFNGDSKIISNITITPQDDQNVLYGGVFGFSRNSKILNLGIKNVNINVINTQERVGGLVGAMEWNNAEISNCFVSGGSVIGKGRTGGLVGFLMAGVVRDSYANVSVSDSWTSCAGLIADIPSNPSAPQTISNVIAYGDCSQSTKAVFHSNTTGVITNALFSKNTLTDAYATLITEDLSLEASYTGIGTFDFTNWKIGSNGFAILKSFSDPGVPMDLENASIEVKSKIYFVGGNLYINGIECNENYSIYNMSGSVVAQGIVDSPSFTTSLGFSKGIYIVKVGTITEKIVVE